MTPHEIVMLIIAAIGAVVAVVTGFVGYQNGLKKNSNRDGEDHGILTTNVEYIRTAVDDLKEQMEKMANDHKQFELNVVREQCRLDGKIDRLSEKVESEHKTMWRRIDDLKEEKKNDTY